MPVCLDHGATSTRRYGACLGVYMQIDADRHIDCADNRSVYMWCTRAKWCGACACMLCADVEVMKGRRGVCKSQCQSTDYCRTGSKTPPNPTDPSNQQPLPTTPHHTPFCKHREGYPCRLYLDIEFDRRANPRLDGEALMGEVFAAVVKTLLEVGGWDGIGGWDGCTSTHHYNSPSLPPKTTHTLNTQTHAHKTNKQHKYTT